MSIGYVYVFNVAEGDRCLHKGIAKNVRLFNQILMFILLRTESLPFSLKQ